MVMSRQSVNLTIVFLGRLRLSGKPVHILSLATENNPFLNQGKGENDCRKYFTINPHERMGPDWDVTQTPVSVI